MRAHINSVSFSHAQETEGMPIRRGELTPTLLTLLEEPPCPFHRPEAFAQSQSRWGREMEGGSLITKSTSPVQENSPGEISPANREKKVQRQQQEISPISMAVRRELVKCPCPAHEYVQWSSCTCLGAERV